MVDLSHACVLCKVTTGLNTRTTIRIVEDEYQVSVCTTCEDAASPKVMRTALSALLERSIVLCNDLGLYLGSEITLDSLCRPKAALQAPVATHEPATVRVAGPNGATSVRMENKPIQRSQRGGAPPAPPAPPRQKIAEQPKDATGRPLKLPEGVVVLENQEAVKNDLRANLGERRFNDGYNTCQRCMGEGGTVINGETTLCTACGGSGLL